MRFKVWIFVNRRIGKFDFFSPRLRRDTLKNIGVFQIRIFFSIRRDGEIIAIGNSVEGIDFKALDREPVYSVIMLLSPEDQPECHLDAMEAIFSSLSQDTFRRFLRQANNTEDVLTLLTETDNAVR